MIEDIRLQTFSKKSRVCVDVTFCGEVLHRRAAATGKARSPIVKRPVLLRLQGHV